VRKISKISKTTFRVYDLFVFVDDDTRVILKDGSDGDYINAAYIKVTVKCSELLKTMFCLLHNYYNIFYFALSTIISIQ